MIVVDVLEEFIAGLDYSLTVVENNYDENLDVTTIKVKNFLFVTIELPIIVDGNEERVVSVDYDTKEIGILGDFSEASSFSLNPPMFTHGTPYAINAELNKEISYPLVYLLEILRERIPSERDSAYATTPSLRLFFLDYADFNNSNTDDLYKDAVTPQRNFAEYFLEKVRADFSRFDLPTGIEFITFAKFGEYVDNKGMINSLFDKKLSGVELQMELPFRKINCK